jgi:hypothetical protein
VTEEEIKAIINEGSEAAPSKKKKKRSSNGYFTWATATSPRL